MLWIFVYGTHTHAHCEREMTVRSTEEVTHHAKMIIWLVCWNEPFVWLAGWLADWMTNWLTLWRALCIVQCEWIHRCVMALTLTNQRLLKLLPSINKTRAFCIVERYFLFSRRKSLSNKKRREKEKRIKSNKQFTMKHIYFTCWLLLFSLLLFLLLLLWWVCVCNCWSRFFFSASASRTSSVKRDVFLLHIFQFTSIFRKIRSFSSFFRFFSVFIHREWKCIWNFYESACRI